MSKNQAEQQTVSLTFEVPDENAPGYLKRQRRALDFAKRASADDVGPEMMDEMVEFLADFVTEPSDRKTAIDYLWDASKVKIDELLDAIVGKGDEPDPPNGEPSGTP